MTKIEQIRDILKQHVGKENSVTSSEIAKAVGYKDISGNPSIRALILSATELYCLPLAADGTGYYLIDSSDEYEKYIKNLDSRIQGIEKRKRIITENFFKKKNNQIT